MKTATFLLVATLASLNASPALAGSYEDALRAFELMETKYKDRAEEYPAGSPERQNFEVLKMYVGIFRGSFKDEYNARKQPGPVELGNFLRSLTGKRSLTATKADVVTRDFYDASRDLYVVEKWANERGYLAQAAACPDLIPAYKGKYPDLSHTVAKPERPRLIMQCRQGGVTTNFVNETGVPGQAFEVDRTRIHDTDFAAALDYLVKRSVSPDQLLQARTRAIANFHCPEGAYDSATNVLIDSGSAFNKFKTSIVEANGAAHLRARDVTNLQAGLPRVPGPVRYFAVENDYYVMYLMLQPGKSPAFTCTDAESKLGAGLGTQAGAGRPF